MDMMHINLKHDSLLHNRAYTQSKTTNLAPNHSFNHNTIKNTKNMIEGTNVELERQRKKEKNVI